MTLSPFDPRAPQGIAQRAAIMATYAANVVVASQSGLLPAWADAGNIPAYLSKIGFFAGNSAGWALTARALIEGMNGRVVEGNPDNKLYNQLARINSWIFTGAGLAWATGDGVKLVQDILANHPIQSAEDAAGVAIKLAYTYAQYKLSKSATAKANGQPGLDPKEQQKTIYKLAFALAASQGLAAYLNAKRLAEKLKPQGHNQGNNEPSLREMLEVVEKAMERDRKAGPAHASGPITVPALGFTLLPPGAPPLPAGTQVAVTAPKGVKVRSPTAVDGVLAKKRAGSLGVTTGQAELGPRGKLSVEADWGNNVKGWAPRKWVAPQPNGAQFANGGRYDPDPLRKADIEAGRVIAINVRPGDSLSKIAKRFGVENKADLDRIIKDNSHLGDVIYPGDVAYIRTELIHDRKHRRH
jgi:hypothetical protein